MGFKVSQKFKVFTDNDGTPLENGNVYIGTTGLNPKVLANQIPVYIDRNLVTYIDQPIRTNGGYPTYNGEKVDIYVDGDYSIIVEDKNEANVYTSLSDNNEQVYGSGLADIDALRGFKGTFDDDVVEVYGRDSFGDGNGKLFYWDSASTAVDNGITVVQPTGVTVGRWLELQANLTKIEQDTSPKLGGPLDTNDFQIQESKGSDIASAATITIPTDGNFFDVTGTNAISTINTTGRVGTTFTLQFDASLTLTYNATSLILPGGLDIITVAGDIAEFTEYSAGNYVCANYQRAGGISELIDDASPQLGGDLDLNGFDIPAKEDVWTIINKTFADTGDTLADMQKVYVDTTGGVTTLNLPATPAEGVKVWIIDRASYFDINNCILGRNGETFMGLAEDFEINLANFSKIYEYNNSDWRIIS